MSDEAIGWLVGFGILGLFFGLMIYSHIGRVNDGSVDAKSVGAGLKDDLLGHLGLALGLICIMIVAYPFVWIYNAYGRSMFFLSGLAFIAVGIVLWQVAHRLVVTRNADEE